MIFWILLAFWLLSVRYVLVFFKIKPSFSDIWENPGIFGVLFAFSLLLFIPTPVFFAMEFFFWTTERLIPRIWKLAKK